MSNNWLSHKIRLLSNRIRCSGCFADSSQAVFIVGENIKYKIPVEFHEDYFPIFKGKSGKMILHKFYELVSAEGLTMVCTRCGKSRKTGIPNGFS